MAVQMFLIHPKNNEDERIREILGEFVFRRGGFVLMATSHGSLIVAMDEIHVESVRKQPGVDFVGPVRLDPNGKLAAQLQQMFAENIAAQLADRVTTRPEVSPGDASRFPPGYRPLRWNRGNKSGGD
jgi:hypothetical protein